MANVTISITIPSAEVERVKKALMAFTGLEGGTGKELAKAALQQIIVQQERQTNSIVPPVLE